jgi:hypothetical protein
LIAGQHLNAIMRVGWNGEVRFRSRYLKVSSALHRPPIAIRPHTGFENCFDLYFMHHRFATINQDEPE